MWRKPSEGSARRRRRILISYVTSQSATSATSAISASSSTPRGVACNVARRRTTDNEEGQALHGLETLSQEQGEMSPPTIDRTILEVSEFTRRKTSDTER